MLLRVQTLHRSLSICPPVQVLLHASYRIDEADEASQVSSPSLRIRAADRGSPQSLDMPDVPVSNATRQGAHSSRLESPITTGTRPTELGP